MLLLSNEVAFKLGTPESNQFALTGKYKRELASIKCAMIPSIRWLRGVRASVESAVQGQDAAISELGSASLTKRAPATLE